MYKEEKGDDAVKLKVLRFSAPEAIDPAADAAVGLGVENETAKMWVLTGKIGTKAGRAEVL